MGSLAEGIVAMTNHEGAQRLICKKYGANWDAPAVETKAGVQRLFTFNSPPIHGLRHPAEPGTSGWFIWEGSSSIPNDDSFFVPMHIIHIVEKWPPLVQYLGLPPGWRFLIAPEYEDVWFDASLLLI